MRLLAIALLAGCASAASDAAVDAARGHDAADPVDGSVHPDAANHPDAAALADAAGSPDVASSGCTFTGALATWDLTTEAGSQAMTAASAHATGVTAGALTRSSGLTAVSGAGSINSSGWPTATARDLTRYYAFSITPPAGCALDLASVAIDTKSSGSGPASVSLATSADSFGAATPVTANQATTVTATVSSITGALEVRIYGFAAPAASGTMRVQNQLVATGSLH